METEESLIRLSGDDIIEQVRESRNELIRKLLHESALSGYLASRHGLGELSSVKREFVRRALKEMLLSSVDLSHYGSLILEIRKIGSMVISRTNERYFYEDIDRVIKNYLL